MAKGKKHIGASGWFYEHWKEVFYPKEVKSEDRLPYYSQSFDTVEINNTFYRLPTEKAVNDWFAKVPDNFIFSIKASRYITHLKRLKDPADTTPAFFEKMSFLKNKLGPILFQLPPSFKQNLERLEDFLGFLDKKHLYTFEFRHPSWFNDETYKILKEYSASLCLTDLKGELSPEVVTSNFIYIRLHGPKEEAYRGEYGTENLKIWKSKIDLWNKQGLDVYCYFDNDEKSFAVKDAKELKRLLHDA